MNRGLDRAQIWFGGSMCISDNLINFWEKIIRNKMLEGGLFENMADQKASGRDILWAIGWIAFNLYAVVL